MSSMAKIGKSFVSMFSNDKKSSEQKAAAIAAEIEAKQEEARKETLKLSKVTRTGFPYKPTCVAYDLMQRIVAIGTRYGSVKIFGDETVEYTLYHNNAASLSDNDSQASASVSSSSTAILFMSFLINQGALITYCEDTTLSLWNLRQKQPCLAMNKKLVNERASTMVLPFLSNWLYIGTEKGNIYILNAFNFSQSGYDIKWNNVIELSQKNKPGRVVHLSEQPLDSSKLLIGYDSGLIVLWNVKQKKAEQRFYGISETLSSISWFYDGKQFVSSHDNGSMLVWSLKNDQKPIDLIRPHVNDTDLFPQYNMIKKAYWEANARGDQLLIFSDGLPSSTDTSMIDAITVIKNNKIKTIVEMKTKIVDFMLVYNSPYVTDNPLDPSAVIVLLENDLVTIDLKTDGYPLFRHHHHSMGLGESPISICDYIVDPSWQFHQSLLASREKVLQQQEQQQQQLLQQQQQQQQPSQTNQNTKPKFQLYSNQPYPICGGVKCSKSNVFPYNELILTGHDDGTIKIWDASGISLVLVQKLKTQKLFDKRRNETPSVTGTSIEQLPYKIIAMSVHKYYLACAAAGGHVTLYKYYSKSSDEELADIPLLEVQMNNEESRTPADEPQPRKELKSYLRTKIGFRKQAGYQPELVCLLAFSQRMPIVNAISINPKNTTLIFGTEESFVCVDYASRMVLYNVSISDIYSNQDLAHRTQKSPKKSSKTAANDFDELGLVDSHNNANILSKQFTIERSFYQQNIRDTLSQHSSNSSSENLVLTEGIAFLAINDNATPVQPTKTNPDIQHYNTQLWLGTNFGSVIVLNTSSLIKSKSVTGDSQKSTLDMNVSSLGIDCTSPSGSSSSASVRPTTVTPTGHVHTLKGCILTIAFLDNNGNVYDGSGSSPSNTTTSNASPSSSSTLSGTSKERNKLTTNASLAIDFTYTPSAQMISNSIADNFYASTSPSSTTSNKSNNNNNPNTPNANATSSSNFAAESSSPTSAGLSQKDSFSNIQPVNENKFEELKSHQLPLSKIKKPMSMSRASKMDMNAIDQSDRNQYAVLCSEQEIKVIALPTQTCIYSYQVADGNLAKASVTTVNSMAYLTCYHTNGSVLVFNLINLKPNLNASLVPTSTTKEKDIYERINKTFNIGNKGHSYFMCTPSEVQKCYLSTANGLSSLAEMFPELFDPKVVLPPAPKPTILKAIFSSAPVDREELFGESSGKPSTSVIKNIDSEVTKANKEMSELVKLGLQRGEKLSELQQKAEEMTLAASNYAKTAHELANKYKKSNKWL